MPPIERLREILPIAVALYVASSVAQLQATQSVFHIPHDGIKAARIVSGIRWHMIEMAKNEQSEVFAAFPGN